mmetsp:Transcript_86059/g.238429  ORF Transcript_86059/g.238429 Transcript_86059/m.238429 type:complete len:619 (+) Transcript_86059:57-1913(+)
MESSTHWLTDAEARAATAEKQRDEAVAKASALESRLSKVENIIQEQQDAIEEMHQAWLAAKGGGGGGYGIGAGSQDEVLQLRAEVEELHRQLAQNVAPPGSPVSRQACVFRAEQAEGRADALERKVEQLLSQVEERDQQLRVLGTAATQVVSQTKRITELESLCHEREQKINRLQVVAAGAESAKAEKQVAENEKKTLIRRVADAEAKATEVAEAAKQQAADLTNTLSGEKEALRRHLTDEFEKEYTLLNEKFEREYAAIRQKVAKAELDVNAASQEAEAHERDREAALKRLEEAEALHKQKLADVEKMRSPDQRLKRLSNHELQALHQRLNAAEARTGAAEAKRRDCEQELAAARQEVEKQSEATREARREKAETLQALEAARLVTQGQMAEASRRVASLAQLQAECDALREQLASQKRSFDRELEDVRSEMKAREDALATTGGTTATGSQVRQSIDLSRRSTGTVGGSSCTSPLQYTPQQRVTQSLAAAMGRSPSLSPLRSRPQVIPGAAIASVSVGPVCEALKPQASVALTSGSSTPPGSSRFELPAPAPLTPMSLNGRTRRVTAPGTVVTAVPASAAVPVGPTSTMQPAGWTVATATGASPPQVSAGLPKTLIC